MKCVKQNGPREWQIGADLTANKPISEIFHAFCSVGGWGVEEGGYRGQKKRQRGGASEAEGGLRGLQMDGNILLFPPALSCCFSHRAVVPVSSSVVRWLEKLHKSWAFIKRSNQSVCPLITLPRGCSPGGDGWGPGLIFARPAACSSP